jgi:hypothetical protein
MGGFFILILLIFLVHYWYVFVGGVALYALWHLVVMPLREYEAREARDRLRHERARYEIDQIALQTTRAMYQAARNDPGIIEGTAEELQP